MDDEIKAKIDRLANEVGIAPESITEAVEAFREYEHLKGWAKVARPLITALIVRSGGRVTFTQDEINAINQEYQYHTMIDTEDNFTLYVKTRTKT